MQNKIVVEAMKKVIENQNALLVLGAISAMTYAFYNFRNNPSVDSLAVVNQVGENITSLGGATDKTKTNSSPAAGGGSSVADDVTEEAAAAELLEAIANTPIQPEPASPKFFSAGNQAGMDYVNSWSEYFDRVTECSNSWAQTGLRGSAAIFGAIFLALVAAGEALMKGVEYIFDNYLQNASTPSLNSNSTK